jgi:hypothetical protein
VDPKEHAFYLRKLAELEARIICIERRITETDGQRPDLEHTTEDPESAVRKLIRLN